MVLSFVSGSNQDGDSKSNTFLVFVLIFTFISLAIMATNTVGLGSLVKKYFSKVVVPDISKPWSHHTDFLVFFLSFLNLGCPFFVSA